MDLYDALVDLAKRCSVINTTPPGQSLLTPSLGIGLPSGLIQQGKGFSADLVTKTVTYVADKPIELDLAVLKKDVRFEDATTAATTIGGMPVVDGVATLPPAAVIDGDRTKPGVTWSGDCDRRGTAHSWRRQWRHSATRSSATGTRTVRMRQMISRRQRSRARMSRKGPRDSADTADSVTGCSDGVAFD
jgi:hypothetical protein